MLACPEGDLAEAARMRRVETITMGFSDYQANHSHVMGRSAVNPVLVTYHGVSLAAAVWKLRTVARGLGVSLIHVNTLLGRLPGCLAGRLAGIPVIWHVRDILSSTLWCRVYDRVAGSMTARVLTVSDACRAQFSEQSRTITVHDGISGEEFHPPEAHAHARLRADFGWKAEHLVVGTFGRITRWKGQRYFLEAAAEVHEDCPDTRWVVVGLPWSADDDKFHVELLDFVGEKGMGESVTITGFRNDIPEMMGACDLVVVPSVQPDPFPNTVLEGMSCGRAVVAVAVGGIPEAIDDGLSGLLVPEIDAAALARAIRTVVQGPELRGMLGEQGRQRVVTTFTPEKTQRAIEKVYEEVLRT